MKTKEGLVAWSIYGALVRQKRVELGYKKAEQFAESLYRRTRVYIGRESLYKIERGVQAPDTLQFLALNIALFGSFLPPEQFTISLSSEWKKLERLYKNGATPEMPLVPDEWARKNTVDAYCQVKGTSIDNEVENTIFIETVKEDGAVTELAREVGDSPTLFA